MSLWGSIPCCRLVEVLPICAAIRECTVVYNGHAVSEVRPGRCVGGDGKGLKRCFGGIPMPFGDGFGVPFIEVPR
jgi:hypothetical protein